MQEVGKQAVCDSLADLKRWRLEFGEADIAGVCGAKDHREGISGKGVPEMYRGLHISGWVFLFC